MMDILSEGICNNARRMRSTGLKANWANRANRVYMFSIAVSGMDRASFADLSCWDTITDADSGPFSAFFGFVDILAPAGSRFGSRRLVLKLFLILYWGPEPTGVLSG
jgi:hypothetical protein